MPEGHTIHRIARDQTPLLSGKKVAVTSPQGRFAEGAALIDRRKLLRIEAFGKHLLYHFDGSRVMQIHLGLYGKYHIHHGEAPAPRETVRVRMSAGKHTIDLVGPNQCRVIGEAEIEALLARLGPDPLNPRSRPAKAWAKIARSRMAIGQLLMDQSVVAGIGNIYRAELLWMIQLHPRTPGNAVMKAEFDALWKLARKWMTLGVELNRLVTVDPKTLPASALSGRSKKRFNIYKRDKCPRCGTKITTFPMAGRKVYVCEGCQALRTQESTK